MRDTSGISSRLGRAIRMLLEVSRENFVPFLVATLVMGFWLICKKNQESSPFEALNTACLSRGQGDVRPPVQMRRGPRAFSRVSTWDSDMPVPSEMKDKPALKPLQGNPAFFRGRSSRCPFHWRQQTQGPSHIPIAEGSLPLKCLWKVCIPLQSKPGNQVSSQDDLGCMDLSSICCAEIGAPLDLREVSQGISGIA